MAAMRETVYQLIGGIIKQKRNALGMKQDVLAGKLTISRGSLANIETGRQRILVHQLYEFAEALDLAPNDLLPPVEKASSLDDWADKLPPGLKPQQQQQVARLMEDAPAKPTAERKQTHVRSSKR